MCMCICLYVYIHIHITPIYSFIYRYLCIQSMYIYVYRNIQTHAHVYILIYVCIYIYIHVYTHTHTSHLFQFTSQWLKICFHILTIGNNAVMNIVVHIDFPISVSLFSRYIFKSDTALLYSSYIFNFLRAFHTVFHSD